MNDIEQNTSSSAPIAPNTYPKVELSSPQLRAYAQWHSASQGPSTSSLATSAQSPNTYGQPYASSLSVVNEIHTQPLPEPNNMGPTMSPPHPMTSANPFQQQSRNASTPIYAPMLLSSAMMMSQGVVRTPMSTPALMTALSSTGSGNMDPLSTTNQNVLSNATISRPPSIVHASPVHKHPAGQHSNSTLEVSSSTMDTALTSTSTPPMQSSSSTPQTEHFYPAQVHSGSPASAAVPTSLTTSSSTRTRSMSYSGPYAFPHFGFSSYPTSSPPVPGAATYTPHPLAQQPITLSSPGVEFSSTTPAQTSSYADPDGVAETGTKARSSPLSSDAVGYYNADLPTSGTPSPMPLSIPGSNKGPGLLRLSIPMSATNKTLGTASQFAQATQNYRQQEHYGSQASGDTYVGQQRERDNALPPPLPPLASSIATGGVSTLPRSMSTGSIHGGTVSVYAPHGGHQALHRQPNGNHPLFNSAVTAFSPMSGPYGSTSSSSGSLSSPSPPASYTTNPAPNAPRSSSRLAGPPLTIPSEPAFSQEANSVAPASATLQPNPYFPDQEYAYTSNVLMAGGHGGVSPVTITPTVAGNHSGSTGGVMSSMISMRGGTTSNGNSVPITPITGPPMGMGMNSGLGMMDGDETLDYYSRLADGLTSGIMTDEDATMDGQAHSLQQQALQRAQMDYGCTDENTDEATTRMMMLGVMTPTHPTSNGNVSPRHISSSGLAMTPTTSTGPGFASINSAGNSPMGGVTRTDRKRRSTTFTAGPNAAAGASRSRSGTLASGGAIQLGGGSSSSALGISSASLLQSALPPMQQSPSQLTANPSLSYAHPQQTYSVPHPLGAQLHALSPMSTMPLQSSLSSASLSTLSSAGSMPSSAVGASLSVNSNLPNNSPLAMKELSPTIKPVIEEYLLRYLNHLCMNPNAKDRMGHQIHQMYTARRIQRYEQLYGWRPLKFRIEAFVNGFVDLLTARGMSQDVTMKIPHYLNNSKLFSRFNESGNRMKSQGQTIWRVRARCKADISGMDVTVGVGQNIVANTAGHPPSAFSQSTMHHQVGMSPQQIPQQQQVDDGLMMAPDPLLWEFLPYERCIVGQPPLAIVGTAWQWNMKVHDHWTPRKKVSWNFVASPAAAANGTSPQESTAASPTSPTGSSSSILMPKWLSLQGSKLKGTPTHPGMYPITVEATFQDDNDPEPVVVRGHFTIQVSKAIGGWKAKMPVPEGLIGSPREGMEDIDGDEDSPEDQGSGGMMLGGAGPSNGGGMQAVTFSSLLGGRTSTYENMYGGHSLTGQSTPLQYVTTPNGGGHVGYYAYVH